MLGQDAFEENQITNQVLEDRLGTLCLVYFDYVRTVRLRLDYLSKSLHCSFYFLYPVTSPH